MTGMVTLRHVAEAAGVSIRTVTRSLKSEPGGNPETSARIRELAARMGYVPNIAARNLKIRQTNIIGLVMRVDYKLDPRLRLRTTLEKNLELTGRYVISGTMRNDEKSMRAMLKEWSGLARDVVFLTWDPRAFDPARLLHGLPMRFIFLHCHNDPRYDTVLMDRGPGVRSGVAWLLKSGHRRIALCGTIQRSRQTGFDEAFQRQPGAAAQKIQIRTRGLEFEHGYAAGDDIVAGKVDAVFFETDRLALGFYRYAHERGIGIPDDVAVIGFDDDPAGRYASPALSTIAHPVEESVGRVCEIIAQPPGPPSMTVFPSRFVQRASVRSA